MVSLVALTTYLVFFASSVSAAVPALFAVVAATMADAEFLVAVIDASVGLDAAAAAAASLYAVAGLVLLIVTGVQSWQSGACVSAVSYRFCWFLDDDIVVRSWWWW